MGLTSTGPFHNLVKDQYWSRTDYSVGTDSAWDFNAEGGRQENHIKELELLAWAVRPGKVDVATSDVQPVPTPATLWLVGAGLLGLGLRRRRWVLRRFG